MSKKRNRPSRATRVRATNSTSLLGETVVMTDEGLERASKAATGAGTAAAVHAPQLMNLSSLSKTPKRGVRELLTLYSDSPWLRAIVNKIARSVADTDWLLYAKKDVKGRYVMPENIVSKRGDVREEVLKRELSVGGVDPILDHPLLTLLARGTGNSRLNGFSAFQVTQAHMELTGEGFWLLEPDELGMPVGFWPLPPSWINNFPTQENPYYELNVPGGMQLKIPTTMIIPFIDPDPADPYGRGTGISKSLDDEIQIDEFAAKHAKAFFLNRARPDIIISGQFISPNDAKRLETQWQSDHQGFWKAFKPLFFSQKIDVKELSQSFESLQMVQMRKHERDTFVSVFGAPPEKFGIIGESKRSTINAADYFWNKDLIKPRVEAMRRVLQQVLVPRFDERLILHYDTPVLQDEEVKLNAMRQAPWAATVNEWRQMQGLGSLGEAGEVLVMPLNLQIIPIKKGEQLATPAEMVEESMRQRALARPEDTAPSTQEVDVRSVVEEVTRDLMDMIQSQFRSLPRQGE